MPALLPVREVEDRIVDTLRVHNRLVLTAPTGSGKTTQVPQMLLRSDAVTGQILVLQPRRMVTRMAAVRVAQEVGCALGDVVGYQTRHDSRVGTKTRIRFLTEGVFLRLLQADAGLRDVGAVILDEFHERNVATDMSLGLVRRLQDGDRPDLRLIVMSATMDAEAVSQDLECPGIRAEGRTYPVAISHWPEGATRSLWEQAAGALKRVLAEQPDGDVLIFMPGAYEIRRTIETCRRCLRPEDGPISFFPLHASLPVAEQDAATGTCPHRKVIVSTNVAETSLTIEGVHHVIDSGRVRMHRFDVRRGLNVLLVESVSRASADQRAGRAGRTAPGTCVRLWSAEKEAALSDQAPPEVMRIDLSACVLQLMSMGVADLAAFPWTDPPGTDALHRAIELLQGLGAVDGEGVLTDTGRQMAALPMHPRLSRTLIAASEAGCLQRAALWVALVSERDILLRPIRRQYTERQEGDLQSDLAVMERAFGQAQALGHDPGRCKEMGIHAGACRDVERAARQYRRTCRDAGLNVRDKGTTEDLVRCLLAGYFDHVALLREPGKPYCAMPGQRRVELAAGSVVSDPGPLVAVDVREVGRSEGVRTVLSLASAVEPKWLEDVHPGRIEIARKPAWNETTRAVEEAETHAYDGLVIRTMLRPDVDPQAAAEILVARIVSNEIRLERWDDSVDHWVERTRCVGNWYPEREMIRYDEDDIRVILHEIVEGATRYSQVKDRECLGYVQQALSWPDRQFVEQMTPTEIRLPAGFRMKVRYSLTEAPRGRAKIQDLYDLADTPTVAGGRQKVLLEILGPNFRPVQVTDDLKSFWQQTYPELKKVLRRRYPKHEWR